MTPARLLFDEHIPPALVNAVLAVCPAATVRLVGVSPDVPPKGTNDPHLLEYSEREGYAIVTFDKDTFPAHADDYAAAGGRHGGLFVIPKPGNYSPGRIAEEFALILGASDRAEWVNLVTFIPL